MRFKKTIFLRYNWRLIPKKQLLFLLIPEKA